MARKDKTQKNATAISASDLLSMFPPKNSCGPKSRSGWQRRASNFVQDALQVCETVASGSESRAGGTNSFRRTRALGVSKMPEKWYNKTIRSWARLSHTSV